MLTDRQEKILKNRTVKGFVNNILSKYPSTSMIICLAHDAQLKRYNGVKSGWNVSLLSVSVQCDSSLVKISTEELWEMFDCKPVLRLGNNNSSRNIKQNRYIRINISTKLAPARECEYYPTSAVCYESKDEVTKLKKLHDNVNQVIMNNDLHSKYSWELTPSSEVDCQIDLDELLE